MKNIFWGAFLMLSLSSYAQNIKIIDKTTLQGIENVQVFNESNPDLTLRSDANGNVDLTAFAKKGNIVFRHVHYTQVITVAEELAGTKYVLYMRERVSDYDDVVISANRFEEKKSDVVQKIQVIRSNDLQVMNQTSTADMLAQSGNVMVQKSQQGGGSPIIRGFETNRVLIVVDGVRMNNAIYRGGHLQNVITLDNAIMDRVEVAFGPSSAVYGSDALGGVMHFFTKKPILSPTDKILVKANAYARYFTAASGMGAHGDISIANRRFGSLTSFSVSSFGDLRQGANRSSKYPDFGKRTWYQDRINGVDTMLQNSDPNVQIGSAYQQLDVLQKFLWQSSENVKQTLNFQYSTSNNVPRYDRLTILSGGKPRFAEWNYGPQNRLFASYMLELDKKTKMYDEARFVLGYQQIEESRITRRFNNNNRDTQLEKLDIVTLNADFEKRFGRSEIRYGIEAYTNQVASSGKSVNILTDATSIIPSRYPDGGSEMNGAAIYATHTVELGKTKGKFILSNGLRLSFVQLKANFKDKTFFPFPFSSITQDNASLTGNLGLIYNPGKDWRITINGSTGFRAPNVDDLSKVFESIPGTVIVPNPDLKSEYSYNGEIGVSKTFNKKLTVSALGYYTYLNNAINVQNSTFEGKDSIVYEGVLSQVRTSVNSQSAYVTGLEGGIRGEISKNVSCFATINYTYGRINTDTTDYPLDHIAPMFGRAGLTYSRTKLRTELFVNYSAAKKLKDYNFVGEDNFSNATVDGMPSWYTVNVRVNYQFLKNLGLQVAVENILDQNYRVFASNISAPGRNILATLRYNF